MKIEGSGCKFRGDEEEDARRPGLRIAPHIFANEADDGFELPFRQGQPEIVCSGLWEETARRTSSAARAQTVRPHQKASTQKSS
jgi:hypothetical protein